MSQGIEAVTTAALGLALDAASLRQDAIASNIANVDTIGYVPMSVSFEDQLGAARRSLRSDGRLDAAALDGVAPRLEQVTDQTPAGSTNPVSLDLEVARLTQNSGHYQELAKALSKHFGILSMAVSDGKK